MQTSRYCVSRSLLYNYYNFSVCLKMFIIRCWWKKNKWHLWGLKLPLLWMKSWKMTCQERMAERTSCWHGLVLLSGSRKKIIKINLCLLYSWLPGKDHRHYKPSFGVCWGTEVLNSLSLLASLMNLKECGGTLWHRMFDSIQGFAVII